MYRQNTAIFFSAENKNVDNYSILTGEEKREARPSGRGFHPDKK